MSRSTSRLPLLAVLRAACGDRDDLRLADFSANDVAWAVRTGLGPLLCRSTASDPEPAAGAHRAALQSADLTARILCGETLDAADEILTAHGPDGATITLLKGISVCDQFYPEPHLRPMGDIDLLVDSAAVEPVESALVALGYERRSRYPPAFYANHHHTTPFFRAATEDWVEVHVALFPPASPPGGDRVFTAANIARELVPSTFRGHEVGRLSAELQVVYLATHWAFELEPVGALVPMVDLLLLVAQTPNLDWRKIAGWLAGSPVAATHLYLLLAFLAHHRLLALEPGLLERLRAAQRSLGPLGRRLAFHLLERYAVEGRDFGPLMTERNFDVVWRTLLLPDASWRNLARLPWRLIPDRFRPRARAAR